VTTTTRPPTARGVELLAWIQAYCDTHGFSPTVREMCSAFAWASPNACQCHLQRLGRCGLLEIRPGRSRTVRVTPAGRAVLAEAAK
jgi:repressor LexA